MKLRDEKAIEIKNLETQVQELKASMAEVLKRLTPEPPKK